VESCAVAKSGAHKLVEAPLELGHELGATVGHNASGCSIKSKYVLHVQVSQLLRGIPSLHRHKVGHLGEGSDGDLRGGE
jgi:hypothetical protein